MLLPLLQEKKHLQEVLHQKMKCLNDNHDQNPNQLFLRLPIHYLYFGMTMPLLEREHLEVQKLYNPMFGQQA
ncbi:MAG: hypothetical protein EBS84_19250 [Proteobacteria bacterium]|nr:hypothetical protein [Pseudomonadota bacterium]